MAMPVGAQQADSMQWSITPYIWGSQTSVDLEFRGNDLGGDSISFSDLLDQLDSALMIHVEGGRGSWSTFADLTYLETSDTEERPLLTVDTESETTVLDVGVAYWPGGVGSAWNLFGGVRYSGFDDRYRFGIGGEELATRRNTNDYYDALIGFRYRFELSPRWSLATHADVSFGDSEGTYMLRAMFAYTVGKRQKNRILFGYQYKQAEFRDSDLRTDFSYYGPLAGFDFRF
jgi:hypothetical protein